MAGSRPEQRFLLRRAAANRTASHSGTEKDGAGM